MLNEEFLQSVVSVSLVVWISDTFYNAFEIENAFTKHLKKCCWIYADYHFSIEYLHNNADSCKISSTLPGPLL